MCAEDIHHRVSRRIQAAADGPAMVLAVATAVPPFVHPTSTYPDYYFDMTNCNHMTALKDKFRRICTSHIHTLINSNGIQYPHDLRCSISRRAQVWKITYSSWYSRLGRNYIQ